MINEKSYNIYTDYIRLKSPI